MKTPASIESHAQIRHSNKTTQKTCFQYYNHCFTGFLIEPLKKSTKTVVNVIRCNIYNYASSEK